MVGDGNQEQNPGGRPEGQGQPPPGPENRGGPAPRRPQPGSPEENPDAERAFSKEALEEQFDMEYDLFAEQLTDEERARYESKQIKENLRTFIVNQYFPTAEGESRGMHADLDNAEFYNKVKDEEKIKAMMTGIPHPESGQTMWQWLENAQTQSSEDQQASDSSDQQETPPSPPPPPEVLEGAEDRVREAEAAARRYASDPTEENKRLAQVAMEKAYDHHVVEHLRKVKPWWYNVLMGVGIAFYLYVGLQYATAEAVQNAAKSK